MSRSAETKPVIKYVLDNGFTVLIRPVDTVPKVSLQLWYGVGSRDESDRERGIAHLIEHMIFKGTEKISESDIDTITHTLSGSCNAFTAHDYTGYLFNLPSHNWKQVLPIMADCMGNCTFKSDMLSSEMKAVIQELKMYKDKHVQSVIEEMLSMIFSDHPYHHPIIGYKQDLWSVSSDDLKAFYKKHYVPNNAALVVVGAVDPQEILAEAKKHFGGLKGDPSYKRAEFPLHRDIAAKAIKMYRDVKQPVLLYAFAVPGLKHKSDRVLNVLEWLLGRGTSSRLYRKLVDEMQLTTSLQTMSYELFDATIFFIVAQPKQLDDRDAIIKVVQSELAELADGAITDEELGRALHQIERDRCELLESNEDQAYEIGKCFFGVGDENYPFQKQEESLAVLKKDVAEIVQTYFRPVLMHSGELHPLPDSEKELWAELQQESDAEDEKILSARIRESEVEGPSYAHLVKPGDFGKFPFPKAEQAQLSNGIKVLAYHNDNTPKIDLILDLKATHYYDPNDKQGMLLFLFNMLSEGTKKHPGTKFAELVESRGMVFNPYTGGISITLLEDDLPFALDMLKEVLSEAEFDEKNIEKVREQILAGIKNFWDNPKSFGMQLIREKIFAGHPYSKNKIGSAKSINSISKSELLDGYKRFVTPSGARISLVGKLDKYNWQELLEKTLGDWQGPALEDINFPALADHKPEIVTHQINRDQFFLGFAAPSVRRTDNGYDKLLLFDQVFGGGVLGSMNSRLFRLRQQSGLFYVINGSLLVGADEEPGIVFVVALVSGDRLFEAEKAIKGAIDTAVGSLDEQELKEGRSAILSASIDRFASNHSIAESFLFLDKFKLPADYFDVRPKKLAEIKVDDVKDAVNKVLKSDRLLTFRIGRVDTLGA